MKPLVKILILLSVLVSLPSFAGYYPITVTDVAGRKVTIEHQPQHIALSTGRVFPLLEMIYQQDAAKHLAAWRDDMRISAPSMYAYYVKKYPELKKIPQIGLIKSGEFDAERFINLKPRPDLFIVDLSNIKLARDQGLLKTLDKAGVKVIAIDFREQPVKNTLDSVMTIAKAVNRVKQGQAFASYYQSHLDALLTTINKLPDSQKHQKVFIERAAGYTESCCNTFGNSNMGGYIPLLSATNVADQYLGKAQGGQLSPETVITSQPDLYIMQTTGWIDEKGRASNGIPLGYAPTHPAMIRQATEKLMDRPWLKVGKDYSDKRIYSIYMPFYNSPYNLVAIEFFAKWIYPQAFKNLDPDQTFSEMNRLLAGTDVSGTFGINNFKAVQ
ncbi:ABC transporter substrate-binding protein [Dongshaea marina]|uniref:ABC transporter substrate-binding protein n=1 Tax=Dongshaea marina TaxID=2047966 RepID=UPI000D3EC488|nr:ABC transporter substrate-binding protein [Dongshaea marina]